MSVIAPITVAPDLAEQAYQAILDAICEGRFAAGQRITQEALAESLSVSRQPVLQALLLLKRDGLVIDAGGRGGVMVAPLTSELIGQLYQVRSVLDGLAAREAARRRAPLPASLITRGRDAARGKDLRSMIDADFAFHRAIYEAAGNPLLVQSAERHWSHIRRIMGATLSQVGARAAIWDEHERMLEAILAGHEGVAQRLALHHCESAGDTLVARVGELGETALHPAPQQAKNQTENNTDNNAHNNTDNNPDNNRRQA